MEGECKQLEQLKKIIQKYYEKEDLKNFLKHIEKEFILKYRFRELYNIADLKKMTEEETKVFYEVMYVYAQKILKEERKVFGEIISFYI